MNKPTAELLARAFKIDLSKNFFQLRLSEVEKVILAANTVKYRKPKNANGSRARYFYAALQRASHKSN